MSGKELGVTSLGSVDVQPAQARRAAVHAADRIAAEHPHPLDDEMPALAGQLIARNPDARRQLLELLDALGLVRGVAEIERLQDREVGLEAELIVATDVNQRLKKAP